MTKQFIILRAYSGICRDSSDTKVLLDCIPFVCYFKTHIDSVEILFLYYYFVLILFETQRHAKFVCFYMIKDITDDVEFH